jgi:hypothetical protein
MMALMKSLCIALICSWGLLAAAPSDLSRAKSRLSIDNRPLARVNGHTISLLDVVKRMDVLLTERFPDAGASEMSLYQFYMANWQDVLDDLIATELILADAQEREIPLSDGDVREELEARFGPNIPRTLDSLSLSYDEALELVRRDLIVERMKSVKVYSKVRQDVTPRKVKDAYAAYLKENPPETRFTYRLLSIRGGSEAERAEAAEEATRLLKTASLEETRETLASSIGPESSLTISLSNDYETEESALSEQLVSILSRVGIDAYSTPIRQTSRSGEEVVRFYHVKARNEHLPLPFQSAYERIQNELFFRKGRSEERRYIAELKRRYSTPETPFTFELDESYQPFSLE